MDWDEILRWEGFWALDVLRGGRKKKYYEEIREAYRHGTSMEKIRGKLRELIVHAVRTTDFYRDFPEELPLEQFPLVNKEIFRENYEAFCSRTYRSDPHNRMMYTSGSTGTPFGMVQDQRKADHNIAGGIFLGGMAGYKIGMKRAFIRAWVKSVRLSKTTLFAQNLIMMDTAHLDDASVARMITTIKEKRVHCLLGYASSLETLSRYIDAYQVDLSGFEVCSIIPISEAMPEGIRRRLREQFHCPVCSWYSNEENGIMGVQIREKEEYYIETESYYYEVLKMDSDEPAMDGELGRLVITDLYNYAFPIIRYENGDLAKCRREKKNGRMRLYLTEVYGRRNDMVYDCEGRMVSPYVINLEMWDLPGIRQYRFIQISEKSYTIELNGREEEIDVEEVRNRLLPYFGEEAVLTVTFTDEIPVLNSGKRKYIENRWKKGSTGPDEG